MADEKEQPTPDTITPSASNRKELAEENARLWARVRELEQALNAQTAEPAASRRSADRRPEEEDERDWHDRVHRTRRRTSSETSRFGRALVLSYVEGLRATGEIISDFADDVLARNSRTSRARRSVSDEERDRETGETREVPRARRRPERYSDRSDDRSESEELARDLPRHLVTSYLDAIDRSTEVSERMVDRFHDSYKEPTN